MQSFAFFLVLYSALIRGGAQLQPATHNIPEGTQSVNGSDVNGGCLSPLALQRVCGNHGSGTISYLIDGIIPVLNTAAPNWASQLVTVRKNSPTVAIPYDHVLLVFDFSSRVSLIVVDLYLFNCPEWNIGAPNITVYVDETDEFFVNYVQGAPGIAVRGNVLLSQSSCDSLLPVRIPLENISTQQHTWYIVVSFEPQPDIEWVHIGEVQLFDIEPSPPTVPSNPSPSTAEATQSVQPTPSTVQPTSSTSPSSSPSTSPLGGSETLTLPAIIGAIAAVLGIIVVVLFVVIVIICIVVSWKSRAETKTDTQEEPYYDYIQEKSTQHATEGAYPLLPIATSVNAAYGTAQEMGQVVEGSDEPELSRPSYEVGLGQEHHTQQRNQPLSFTINMAYGALQEFSV